MTHRIARSLTVAVTAAAMLALAIMPAHAFGAVSGSADGDAGRVTAECAYTANLPGTNARRVDVALTATARATASNPANPVISTRVQCSLESATGVENVGATRVGPLGYAEGVAGYDPTKADDGVLLCFEASAQYDNGDEVEFARRCVDFFDTNILKVKTDIRPAN